MMMPYQGSVGETGRQGRPGTNGAPGQPGTAGNKGPRGEPGDSVSVTQRVLFFANCDLLSYFFYFC